MQSKGFTFTQFDATEMRNIAVKEVYPRLVVDDLPKRILEEIRKL